MPLNKELNPTKPNGEEKASDCRKEVVRNIKARREREK